MSLGGVSVIVLWHSPAVLAPPPFFRMASLKSRPRAFIQKVVNIRLIIRGVKPMIPLVVLAIGIMIVGGMLLETS